MNSPRTYLENAALYMELYERQAPNLRNPSARAYQICAATIIRIANTPAGMAVVKQVANQFPVVQEFVKDFKMTQRIASQRMFFFPELDELIERLTDRQSNT